MTAREYLDKKGISEDAFSDGLLIPESVLISLLDEYLTICTTVENIGNDKIIVKSIYE